MVGTATTVQKAETESVAAEVKIRRDAVAPVRSILAALASRRERVSLRRICRGTGWTLRLASTFPDVEAALRASSFGVVICSGQLADDCSWKDVLIRVQRMPVSPQVIVADRLADEALWAEVLNLGCYDLLMTPFSSEEVLRVVSMAWDSWQRELRRTPARPKPPQPAEPEWRSFNRASATGAD